MKLHKLKLKNGLDCLIIDEPFFDSIYLSLFVKVGSYNESYNKNKNCTLGMAHFCEHLLFAGSNKYNKKGEIFEKAQSIGGKLNAYTADDHTKYYLQYPKKNEKNAFELLSQMYFCSNFTKSNFEGEKNIVNEEYKQRIDDPETYLYDIKNIISFKGSRYETCVPELLEKCTNKYILKDLLNFYFYFYRPENCYLVYCGKKDRETINYLNKYFDKKWPHKYCRNEKSIKLIEQPKWISSNIYPKKNECPNFIKKILPNVDFYHFKRNVNKVYFILFINSNFEYKNLFEKQCLEILSLCTGGYMSSRLMNKLRIKKSLIYSIDSNIISNKKIKNSFNTCFNLSSSAANENYKECITLLIKELFNIYKNGFTSDEVESAKKYLIGNFIYGFENIEDISHFFGINKIIDNKLYSKNKNIKTIEKIRLKDINNICKKVMLFENIQIVNITNKHLHLI